MLQPGDLGRDKNPQMADMRINQIDNALTCFFERFGIGVNSAYPVQCLTWRRNLVAFRSKDKQRVFDIFQSNGAMLVQHHLAAFYLVADKQIFDRGRNFLFTEGIKPVPPTLEG